MTFVDSSLPTDTYGRPSGGGYAPSVGVLPPQLGTPTADSSGQKSAPLVVTQSTASNFNATVSQATVYPVGATPLNATSGDVAAATAAAALGAASGKTTYITGFSFSSTGSTSATTVDITVSDGTWTITFVYVSVAGATTANAQLNVTFPYPLAASAVNTAITTSCPTLGTGNLHACMNAYGFRL